MDFKELLNLAIKAAIDAGQQILEIYGTDFEVEIKNDLSPVTKADKKASDAIIRILSESGISVLSEEGEQFPYEKRKEWNYLWIVDPLDGTKEFVKRNGEFTVNIALVENQKPVIGVIYSPVTRILYFALKNEGSFKVSGHDVLAETNNKEFKIENILASSKQLPLNDLPRSYTVVASRSHLSREVSERIRIAKLQRGDVNIINTGSSIKFCWVAEGLAHEYPRYGTTMEWDTAAGQCIIEQSGGSVIDQETKQPLVYNRQNLENHSFIAFSKN